MDAVCALALVLLVDTSGSVDETRYALQHQGMAEAFSDPRVIRALVDPPGGTAVAMVEWEDGQHIVIPWRRLVTEADVLALTGALAGVERGKSQNTALGDAMKFGVEMFASEPCVAERRVIDVSGDGSNNSGWADPIFIRDLAEIRGITINGLPIINDDEPDLPQYYRSHVVTSDGRLVEARDWDDLARATLEKLLVEVASLPLSAEPVGR